MKNLKIHLALILVSILFGVNFVANKVILDVIPPGAWAFGRIFLTGLFMAILVFVILKQKNPTGRQWLTIGFLSLFGVVINQITFFEGLTRTTATHSAIINTTIPIFVLFFSLISGQEKWEWHRAAGMALGVIGVLIVIEIEKQHFDSVLFWGDLLNLINSMSFSFYLVKARTLNRQINPLVVTAGMFVIGALGAGIYGGSGALAVDWGRLSWAIYSSMAFVVLGASVGTYSLNNWALSKTDSTMVALYGYIQPVVAGYLSRFIYHEEVTLRMVVASLFVFSGVALGSVLPPRKKKENDVGA